MNDIETISKIKRDNLDERNYFKTLMQKHRLYCKKNIKCSGTKYIRQSIYNSKVY